MADMGGGAPLYITVDEFWEDEEVKSSSLFIMLAHLILGHYCRLRPLEHLAGRAGRMGGRDDICSGQSRRSFSPSTTLTVAVMSPDELVMLLLTSMI